ncbi:MAG: ABC transporter permease [Gloeocapsa sp. UFS-A4-WI-NPMV-4B04]|jgi:NitT/TauT family transport system permease protein|nr:ABC transporter permease [Gloeocapsa sp. UFS-A4-WI-NPMV-4B04]
MSKIKSTSALKLKMISLLASNIGTLIILLLWWGIAQMQLINPLLLPTPQETLVTLWVSLWQDLPQDFFLTLYRSLYAFVIAAVMGVPVGIILGSNEQIYYSCEFLIDFFRSTPATAMFPLFLIIFGIDDFSKIAVAAFAAWLIVFFNVAYGVMSTRKTRILAARVIGAPRWRIFFDVVFFETLPQTFIGLRTAISLTLVVIIVAEMFIGSTNGMGQRIIDAQQTFDLKQMYASIIATGIMGYSLNQVFLVIEKRFVHWKGK